MHVEKFRYTGLVAALMLSATVLSGCATPAGTKADVEAVDRDPLEPFNRTMHGFNRVADKVVLRPVASGYRAIMPEKGREMVTNFLQNLYTPVEFTNSVLQADPQNSFTHLWRFLINSSFGVAGLFDPATELGLKARHTDFGQTLALYGVDSGAYVVLPFFGPSSIRDGIGRGVDTLINPITYLDDKITYSVAGATAIDWRSNNMSLLDDVYNDSLDPYATFRSGWTQKRAADIRRAKAARQKAWDKAVADHQ